MKSKTKKQLPPAFHIKQMMAAKLTNATGGKVQVRYVAASFLRGDRDAEGHLFTGRFMLPFDEDEPDEIVLDDRRPEGLQEQLIRELNRVSEFYEELATAVKAAFTDLQRPRNRQRCEVSNQIGEDWETKHLPAESVWKHIREAAKQKGWRGSIISILGKRGAK